MATLLAAEASRPRRDAEGKGRLFGFDFPFDPRDAIQDLSLALLERYTSGPYERSAWLLTQIRARVGEEAFWRELREVLDDHRLGSIDSETFLESFAPALDAATIARALAALERHEVPELTVDTTGAAMRIAVSDPGGVLLAPLEVTVVDGAGAAAVHAVDADGADVVVPADGYLAIDERDVHPNWPDSFEVPGSDYFDELAPRFLPTDSEALAAFGTRSAAAQDRAMWTGVAALAPETFPALYASLDSTLARFYAGIIACRRLRAAGAADDAWIAALEPILRTPALVVPTSSYAACGVTLGQRAFGAEIAALAADPASSRAGRIGYVMSFDQGAGSFEPLARIATTAPSLQMREQAVNRLAQQAPPGVGYSMVPAEQTAMWKTFFRDRLAEVTTLSRFLVVWNPLRNFADDAALAAAGAALRRVPMSAARQRQTVCEARALAAPRAGAWEEFQAAAQPWTTLSMEAQQALADPVTACGR
jgi:hypothetical protein